MDLALLKFPDFEPHVGCFQPILKQETCLSFLNQIPASFTGPPGNKGGLQDLASRLGFKTCLTLW